MTTEPAVGVITAAVGDDDGHAGDEIGSNMRRRWTLPTALVLLVAGLAGAWVAARAVEVHVVAAIREKAAVRGMTARAIAVSWPGTVRLEGAALDGEGGEKLTADEVRITLGLSGGRDVRDHVRHVALRGVRFQRGPLAVHWASADLEVVSWRAGAGHEQVRLRQRPSGGEIEARWRAVAGDRAFVADVSGLDLSGAVVSWAAEPVLIPGSWSGHVAASGSAAAVASEGSLEGQSVRIALPRGPGLGTGEYGAPTHVALSWSGAREGESIDVQRLRARVGGVELTAHGRIDGPPEDRNVNLELSTRTDLGSALQTTAVRLPASLTVDPAARLGTAALDLDVRGPLARPALLAIVPRLRYDGTPQAAEKLEFLRRPFRYTPAEGGPALDVRDGAPDFIALGEVPPLFLRAVLVSEDAGFYGHPGIDVAEIPVAWAANLERGTSARGASTITQQLVKNLFLSKDKSYARKLEEAALALLVDAALPKPRILEIYVNVIEWGPGLYGLVPAARHYFGKTPAELTPKEMAFLVCLIPSPIRYHQAHVAGRVGPGMEQLMDNLLAKLHSVDAITEDEYATALAEEVRFQPEPSPETETPSL
jgi:penicillin-binding protein 1A